MKNRPVVLAFDIRPFAYFADEYGDLVHVCAWKGKFPFPSGMAIPREDDEYTFCMKEEDLTDETETTDFNQLMILSYKTTFLCVYAPLPLSEGAIRRIIGEAGTLLMSLLIEQGVFAKEEEDLSFTYEEDETVEKFLDELDDWGKLN